MTRLRDLRRLIERERMAAQELTTTSRVDLSSYSTRPVEYAREILHIETLTPAQEDILRGLVNPPRKVLVPSAHGTGKTFIAAVAANWWYDSFPEEGLVLTTAPGHREVVELLWAEIRVLRQRAGLPSPFIGPRAPEMFDHELHYAKGFTARRGETFKGRHRKRMLFIFDEGNEISPLYYTTTRTMFDPAEGHAWLVIFNPTDPSSAAYQEDLSVIENPDNPPWMRLRLSALDHPNILAGLRGESRPIRGAVSLEMVNEWLRDWCEPLGPADNPRATDLEWPPPAVTGNPGKWYRPGPEFQSRAMGIWPDVGSGLWSDSLWAACVAQMKAVFPHELLPRIGCDTSTGKGEDFMSIHARWGNWSFHHETSNTMDPVAIYGRLKEVARLCADRVNFLRAKEAKRCELEEILILIDDDGVGRSVAKFLMRDGYSVKPVGAGTVAREPARYPNRRSELWFSTADRARSGGVNFGLLGRDHLRRLRQQMMGVTWDLDARGRRVVESKDDLKRKIGRSPDDADAVNLAYMEGTETTAPNLPPETKVPTLEERFQERHQSGDGKRRLFG